MRGWGWARVRRPAARLGTPDRRARSPQTSVRRARAHALSRALSLALAPSRGPPRSPPDGVGVRGPGQVGGHCPPVWLGSRRGGDTQTYTRTSLTPRVQVARAPRSPSCRGGLSVLLLRACFPVPRPLERHAPASLVRAARACSSRASFRTACARAALRRARAMAGGSPSRRTGSSSQHLGAAASQLAAGGNEVLRWPCTGTGFVSHHMRLPWSPHVFHAWCVVHGCVVSCLGLHRCHRMF